LSVTGGGTNGVGQYNATCSGGSDVAGNAASAPASAAYNVIYNWRGFLSPIANPPTKNKIRAGKSLALPFSLGGNYGLNILASGSPASRQINCSTGAAQGAFAPITNSSLTYSASTGRYAYTWLTSRSWKGSCREFVLTLNDGTSHSVRVKLKR
jgi:hypothetical protein